MQRRGQLRHTNTIPDSLYNGLLFNVNFDNATPVDQTGNFTLSNTGASTGQSGKLGGSYLFDTGDFIDFGSSQVFGGRNAMTLVSWTKNNNPQGSGQLYGSWGSPRSSSIRQDLSGSYNRWICNLYIDGVLKGGVFKAPSEETWTQTENYSMLLIEWDGNQIRVSVNLVASPDVITATGSAISIGGQTERIGKSQLDAKRYIDNTYGWDRILTPSEKASLYNNGNGIAL
jgi:hypothetical protein